MEKRHILSVLMIALLALFGCSQAEDQQVNLEQTEAPTEQTPQVDTQTTPSETPQTSAEAPTSDEDTSGVSVDSTVKEFEVVGKRFEFEPSVITVNQGDRVILHLTSPDVGHGIGIPAFGVNVAMPAGKTVDAEFIADEKGEFPFICNVYCGSGHRDMKGMIVVR